MLPVSNIEYILHIPIIIVVIVARGGVALAKGKGVI